MKAFRTKFSPPVLLKFANIVNNNDSTKIKFLKFSIIFSFSFLGRFNRIQMNILVTQKQAVRDQLRVWDTKIGKQLFGAQKKEI